MRKPRGFTMVEIMIVVSIIGMIAAIAIPNLLRARHNANETAAIGNTKTIADALESFRANQVPPTYPGPGVNSAGMPVTNLQGLSQTLPAYIDVVLGSGQRQGYRFTYVPTGARVAQMGGQNFQVYDSYELYSDPITPRSSGTRGFFVDQTGVIRSAGIAPAKATDVPLE